MLLGRRRVLLGLLQHTLRICLLVRLVQLERQLLRGIIHVWLVEQLLDAEQNLLDGDAWRPILFLIQDGKAHGARREDIGVKEGGLEYAW